MVISQQNKVATQRSCLPSVSISLYDHISTVDHKYDNSYGRRTRFIGRMRYAYIPVRHHLSFAYMNMRHSCSEAILLIEIITGKLRIS